MSKLITIRLSDELNDRLVNIVKQSGHTPTYYMREAITAHIENLEDTYLAEQVLDRVRDDKERVLASEEFWNGLAN